MAAACMPRHARRRRRRPARFSTRACPSSFKPSPQPVLPPGTTHHVPSPATGMRHPSSQSPWWKERYGV